MNCSGALRAGRTSDIPQSGALPQEASSNGRTYGVTFLEAMTAFQDDQSVTFPDVAHSFEERRYLLVGRSTAGRILVISHAEVSDGLI